MKTIGLIGGMSWESTAIYRHINQAVKARLGGLHSARLVMHSVDFHDIEVLQRADRWGEAGALLGEAGRSLQGAGAELLVLCTNTMHRVAPQIEAAVSIPFLHIADATAAAIAAAGLSRIALLGTRFTMEQDFYVGRLRERFGLDVMLPSAPERERVHRIIYDELCQGVVRQDSRDVYETIVDRLASQGAQGAQGAQGVIFGCTEITMLLDAARLPLPVFDTTRLHAEQAVDLALT
jgi:aspartate racemase